MSDEDTVRIDTATSPDTPAGHGVETDDTHRITPPEGTEREPHDASPTPDAAPRFSLRLAAHSETGRVRKNNQDSGYASPTMIVVADGMGGAAAGDLASAVAITELARGDQRRDGEQMLERFSGLIERANDHIADLVASDLSLDGMGTTVCGAMFSGCQFGLAHIGDSRGYLVRDGRLIRLTHDHSYVQSLVDTGRITPEQALVHPHRSLLLQVLNGQPQIDPDFELIDAQLGDRVMFCSDGLCGLVDDDGIAELIVGDDLDLVVRDLVDAANDAGGIDNITVVIADVVEQDDALDAGAPMVLGAASERGIPTVSRRSLDRGDDAADEEGYPTPATPAADALASEAETTRYAPEATKNRWLGTMLICVAVLALVSGGAWAFLEFAKNRYYVGAHDNYVAIFTGLPGEVLGYELHDVHSITTTRVADLPTYYQDRVARTISVPNLSAAQSTTAELDAKARKCIEVRADRASASASPSATPTGPVPTPPSGSPSTSGATGTSASGTPSDLHPTPGSPTAPPAPSPSQTSAPAIDDPEAC